jgi:Ca2+-binding RTX toxin-like protein
MASSYGWMFASPGDWNSISNWQDVDLETTGVVPAAAADAFIMGAALVTISAGESFQVQDLNLASYALPGSATIGTPEVLLQSGTLAIGGNLNDTYTVAGYVPPQYVSGGGTPPISVSGGGTIALSGGSSLSIGGTIGTDIGISFNDDAHNTLTLGGFAVDPNADAGTIAGFAPGDTIDLNGILSAGATEAYDPSSQQISIDSNGVLAAAFRLTGNGYSSSNFSISDDGSGNAMLTAAPSGPKFWVDDTSTNSGGIQAGTVPAGEASYLSGAYFYHGSDNVLIAATTPSVWMVGGAGNDAIVAQSGNNVLDGGTGSNFLIGGTGTDTFFLDARGGGVTWDSVENFNHGDLLVLWGWNTGVTTYNWTPNDGYPGYTGETLHASLNGDGAVTASVTFVSTASTDNLLLFQGPAGGIPFAVIYNAG